MTIYRNGKPIELTDEEIGLAFRERQMYYYTEDVKLHWENMFDEEFPYDDDRAEHIAKMAESIMNKNDGYFESYWASFEAAIDSFRGR